MVATKRKNQGKSDPSLEVFKPVSVIRDLRRLAVNGLAPIGGERVTPADVGLELRGGPRAFYDLRAPLQEVFLDGPAGTGKTLTILWRLHLLCHSYPGSRVLMVRKTHSSLTASAIDTFESFVISRFSAGAKYMGGAGNRPGAYIYPNGSRIVVGGMDRPDKVMSSEYDAIYVNEATELREDEWEKLLTRRRRSNWPFKLLVGDANPQGPQHWYHQRSLIKAPGRFHIPTTHKDNPRYFDARSGQWTQEGKDYVLGTLGALTGVRYQRLALGLWVSAEGQVYETFDPNEHIITRDSLIVDTPDGPMDRLSGAWHIGGADWGYVKPGCLSVWAVTGDGDMYRVAEVYRTTEHVDPWWMDEAEVLQREFNVQSWECDPSEPQYIAKFRERGLNARAAVNAISPGIQAVDERFSTKRIHFIAESNRHIDKTRQDARLPWNTEGEIGEYVWPSSPEQIGKREIPVQGGEDHGLDAMRYAVAGVDLRGMGGLPQAPSTVSTDTYFQRSEVWGRDDDEDDPWFG